MPKKSAINGFSLYMHELREEYRKRGQNISLPQISNLAAPLWKEFSKEKKDDYNKKAKALRKGQVATAQKLASDGTSIDENYREMEQEQQMERLMRLNVSEYVGANEFDPEAFIEQAVMQFHYIMAFNCLCRVDDIFIPVEIGIVKYSIKYGISDIYHKIIDPGHVPPGLAGKAKEHSESTHNLMFAKDVEKENNYKKIWKEVIQFLSSSHQDVELPPIFTLGDAIPQTTGCLTWLSIKAVGRPSEFRVWKLEDLLYDLRLGAGESLLSHAIAADQLSKTTYDYAARSRCDYHEEQDSVYCALAMAKRLCYLMSDCVCNVFKVELTGNHLPFQASAIKNYHVEHSNHVPAVAETSVPRPMRGSSSYASSVSGYSRSVKSNYDELDDFSDEPVSRPMSGIGRGLATNSVVSLTQGIAQMQMNADMSKGIGRGRPMMMPK